MDIQKKKMLQEKIYKMPPAVLRRVVDTIVKSNPNIKFTKTLNGYFFNMAAIDDTVLESVYDFVSAQDMIK